MDGATLTFINIVEVTALVVLFFIVLDIPVVRPTKNKASVHTRNHRK